MPEITNKNQLIFDIEKDLTEEEKENFNFVKKRIKELQEARQESQYGTKIEKIWADADKDYMPHRLGTVGKRVIATDEEKGWRGTLVTLGSSDWQSDVAKANPYIKIQTALAILIDRNPTAILTPGSKKYQATNSLISNLYQRSWEIAKSKQQLKLFVFNLAKYGWAVGRTYPLKISRKIRNLVEYNEEKPEDSIWEEKEIISFNDIFRENLDPWNTWIDDMAEPNNPFSIRDWCFRKVYSMDVAEEEFGKYKNWKYVKYLKNIGITTEKIGAAGAPEKKFKEKNLIEVYFYENQIKDLFEVHIGGIEGIPIIQEPLPISDAKGNKKLSLWQTYWNLRHAKSPYGIGIYEAIRYDNALLDRIRNMTIDQLTLSIYKMFFYQGTTSLKETGDIKVSPGIGKQVFDSKSIQWLEVPGPGAEAWEGIKMFQSDVDDDSGITPSLIGEVTGKTAFEIAQAKESALKRLKTPLDNICDALEQEGYITVSLIDLLYSIPETYKITDPALIENYLKEIQSDPELYNDLGVDEQGRRQIEALVYREFPLNLEEDEKGNLIETAKTRFFRIKPKFLKWEGIINIKAQSVLTPSKQLDKALELEMYNLLIPLLAQPPEIYQKIAKNICKLYDKDPKDILPDVWLQMPQTSAEQPVIVPAQQALSTQMPVPKTEAETLLSRTEIPQQPKSLVQKLISKLVSPLRKI